MDSFKGAVCLEMLPWGWKAGAHPSAHNGAVGHFLAAQTPAGFGDHLKTLGECEQPQRWGCSGGGVLSGAGAGLPLAQRAGAAGI